MTHIFYLKAVGSDFLSGSRREIETTTCFVTKEAAESRILEFRNLCISRQKLDATEPIEITIEAKKVIHE